MAHVPSIYQCIRTHLRPDGALEPSDLPLPDDGFVPPDERTPPGVRDAAALHRPTGKVDAETIAPVLDALALLCRRPSPRSRRQVDAAMRPLRCVDIIDPLLQAVRADERIDPALLYGELHRLATESHWRETVKLCIALLGLYRRPEAALLLETLGRHEEFTFFVTVALGNILDAPAPDWLRLVPHVHGWGKIHLVQRLAQHADQPDVRHWLLHHGVANRIHPNYLALTVAEACDVHQALAPDLTNGVQVMLDGLLTIGPRPGMERYEHGALVAEWWLAQQVDRPSQLAAFLTATRLLQWLERPACNWPEETGAGLRAQARALVRRPDYADLALANLTNEEPSVAWQAREVAAWLSLPVFERLLPLIVANPADARLWLYLAGLATPRQMEQLLTLPGHDQPAVLPGLIRALRRFPGVGLTTVQHAAKHPEPVIRLLALDLLGRWPAHLVPPDLALQIIGTADQDPHPAVRKSARVVKLAWHTKT